MAHITVEYPTILEVVVKTAEEMKALGYKAMPQIAYLPVNRKEYIKVKTGSSDVTALCLAQTGFTPEAYQAKFNRAWNA